VTNVHRTTAGRSRPGNAHEPPTDVAAANTMTAQRALDGEIDQDPVKTSPRHSRGDVFVLNDRRDT
jgi:hypothetical protein